MFNINVTQHGVNTITMVGWTQKWRPSHTTYYILARIIRSHIIGIKRESKTWSSCDQLQVWKPPWIECMPSSSELMMKIVNQAHDTSYFTKPLRSLSHFNALCDFLAENYLIETKRMSFFRRKWFNYISMRCIITSTTSYWRQLFMATRKHL